MKRFILTCYAVGMGVVIGGAMEYNWGNEPVALVTLAALALIVSVAAIFWCLERKL